MKIGLFTDCYYPQVNGVVTSVMLLKESLTELGHQVFIITVAVPGYDASSEENVIRIPSVPFAKWKEFRVGIPTIFHNSFRQVRALGLDVIHTHTEFSLGLLGRFFAKHLHLPVVHTYHTMYEDYTHYVLSIGQPVMKALMKKGSKFYVQGYDLVIVPSKKTKNALRGYGVTNEIAILPTGINVNQFDRLPKNSPIVQNLISRYGYTEKNQILLSLGRVSQEKSIDFLIEAMPELLAAHPELRLLIVGDGPYRVELEKLVQALSLENAVCFAGRIPFCDVSQYYSLADFFVNASKTETQGLTIFEAMATTLPVIVYDDENVTDVVVAQKSGYLFTDRESYVKAVDEALRSPGKTQTMAKKGKEIVDSLSKEAFGQHMAALYQRLIRQKQEAARKPSFFA